MLVTRPQPDASETAARLAALDIEAALCPLLRHETLPSSLPDGRGFAALALTSTNALRALEERNVLKDYLDLPVYAVGDRTAAAARDLGFATVTSAAGSFADLVEVLAHAGLKGPVFYPAGREQAGDLPRSLAPFGVMVIVSQVYAMQPLEVLPAEIVGELEDGSIDAVLFYSRRTAETFARLCESQLSRLAKLELGVLCLSENVAEPLVNAHFVRIGLADYPSEEAMMALALSFSRDRPHV
jgi:uroporphyrinogen-III synthase